MARTAETGRLGEDLACRLLERRGIRILERNLRLGKDEIDILAADLRETFFVEVKTTTTGKDPFLAIDDAKMDHMYRGMGAMRGVAVRRADVISVELSRWGAQLRWLQRVS